MTHPDTTEAPKCQWCKADGAVRYRQDTKYVEEHRNWVTLCPECKKENDEHWKEMWSDFYDNCM